MLVVLSVTLEVTVRSPEVPEVPETSERREPLASVMTLALTPMAAELMAVARVARVLLDELMVTVCAVPEPT